MSSSNSTVFRMYKKAKQFSEPNKIIVEGLKIAASVNLVAVNEDSEEALTFISRVVSTATNTGEFLEGTMCVARLGNGIKIPLPPKVPSGSHQCYSHLCFWHIFTSQFIFHVLFFTFWCFYVVPPSLYSLLFTCYPLHFIHILLYLYFTFYFSLFDSFTWYPLHFIRFYLPVTPSFYGFILWVYFM